MSNSSQSSKCARRRDTKPSDIYELRLQTQRAVARTRRLRTHEQRIQQRIQSSTSAINKTLEQQTEEPSVVISHANSVPQLRRSLDVAEHRLAALQEQIEQTREHDKTYIVKELEEEIKIIYSECQRLSREFQQAKVDGAQVSASLEEAERVASPQRLAELRAEVREAAEDNATLRDKTIAYFTKSERAAAEFRIMDHQIGKVRAQVTIAALTEELEELGRQTAEEVQALDRGKAEQRRKLAMLRDVIEEQKQKIAATLAQRAESDF
jgi:inhibitor of KinA sporulation pathway (predicted exonuclease)